MIAITGASGSGKTTLARALQARLGAARCQLVTEDHYYFGRAHYGPGALAMTNAEIEDNVNFDDPATKDMARLRADIAALRRGETVAQPVYDFTTHERVADRAVAVDSRPVVIVEGIHVLSDPAFAQLFDLRVFVDAPVDLRLIRRIQRDAAERGRPAERVIRQYLRFVRAAHARFTEPARDLCDVVVVCEAAPADRMAAPDPDAVSRLAAPVWLELEKRGVTV